MVQVSLNVDGQRDTIVPLFVDIDQQRAVMQTAGQEQEQVRPVHITDTRTLRDHDLTV